MKRRRFVLGLGAMAGSKALPALAQKPGRVYRVAAMFGVGGSGMHRFRAALTERLASHGFVEGRNLQIDAHAATGIFHEDRDAARVLLATSPDAMFTCLIRVTEAARAATQSVPIIFVWIADPVASGLVMSYAKPGGNLTGVSSRAGELLAKRLQLIRELLPSVKRVAVLGHGWGMYESSADPVREAAAALRIDLLETPIQSGWVATLDAAAKSGAEACLAIHLHALQPLASTEMIQFAVETRMPVVFADADAVVAGGLISYGTNLVDDVRRGADLVARVLMGAMPADLPVDQAARFELAVNLRTAKALGLTIPQSVLLRADRVIE